MSKEHPPGGDPPSPDANSPESTKTARPRPLPAHDTIGPYKILETLGEGGMGTVYLAEQTSPVHRRVALKIVKLGMQSKEVIARFEAEREALALMNHSGVAKVFDAGVSDEGRPYFVMEHVPGVAITDYCDRNRLSTNQRLELFMLVCHAVQHAHQKGIIHRDLKPGNILVAVQDGAPVPKVIDFGVAKAMQQRLTERTLFTEQGQLIGTPGYMSPEQAEMSALDIDTRTDVYALGVLLYELLVGQRPFDDDSLRHAGFAEIQRIIREVEPPKPSTRLSGLGDTSTQVAHQRRTEIRTLSRVLRGDLDWVVMKCLEKDRNRRYDTANALAMEIARFLGSEPVLAGPPSAAYRLRKFVRRNKGQVTAVGAVIIALAAGLIISTTFYLKAEHARAEAENARAAIVVERDNAQREAETAKQVQKFLIDLFKVSDPSEAKGNSITAREIMDKGADRIGRELGGQPLIQAVLLHTISRVYEALGLCDKALPLAQQALRLRRQARGDEHPDVASSLCNVAIILYCQGRYAEAEELQREALTMRRRLLGNENQRVASSLNNLAADIRAQGRYTEAEKLYRQALAMRRKLLGSEHPLVATTLNNLANALTAQGKYAEEEKLRRQALAMRRKLLGNKHPAVAWSLIGLAGALESQDRYSEAERLYREGLAMMRKLLGDEHPDVARSLNNLAKLLTHQGEYARAEGLFREALAMLRKRLGDEHPDVAARLYNVAVTLDHQGKYEEAEVLHRQSLATTRRLLGDEHPDVALCLHGLAETLRKQSKHAEAERLQRQSLAMRRKLLGDEHPEVAQCLHHLAFILDGLGRYDEAEQCASEALAMNRKLLGDEHSLVASCLEHLGSIFAKQGKYAEAERLHREALAMQRKISGDEHPGVAQSLHSLGSVLAKQGKYAEAKRLYREALAMNRKFLGNAHPIVALDLSSLCDVLTVQGKFEEARPVATELLAATRAGAEKTTASVGDLNSYAWTLLTIEPEDLRDPAAALPFAHKAVKRSGGKNANIMDTLALAHQMTGDVDAAVETEKKAIALLPPEPSLVRTELQTNLAKFLVEQESYAQAEPLLLALHQQLDRNPKSSIGYKQPLAKQKQESIELIIELYDAWHAAEPDKGHDAKAAQWRAKLPAAPMEETDKAQD